MSISVTCTSCQYKFAVPAEFAGKKGKCPKCGAVNTAPGSAPAPSAAPAEATKSNAPAKAAAPPVKLKTAHALNETAPAKPAPLPAPNKAPAPAAAPAPSESKIGLDVAPAFHFDAGGASGPHSTTRHAAKKPSKAAPNTGLMIALGAGGGVLALALVIGIGYAALSGGDSSDNKVAKNDVKNTDTTGGGKKKSKKKPAEEDTGGLLDKPAKPERERPGEGFAVATAKPVQAKNFDEVLQAIVKIETPTGGGMSLGTGFLINDKGWIATNWHVVENATSQTTVIMDGGQRYEIAGLIAKAPERDLAIIKMASRPYQITTLDITYSQRPSRGTKVFAFGHPHNATFSLSDGIVSKVATTDELDDQSRLFVLAKMKGATDHVWIQHTAKIAPGNSGGPLFLDDGRVLGINTWVSPDFGYAGSVDFLRDLVKNATDTVTPFKQGNSQDVASSERLRNIVPTADRIQKLIEFCGKFSWKPTNQDQFNSMAELAVLITLAKKQKTMPEDVKQAATEACNVISKLTWSADMVQTVNKFATDATSEPFQGMICVGVVKDTRVKGVAQGLVVDQLQIEGTNRFVVVKTLDNKLLAAKDKRVLLIGWNSPGVVPAPTEAQQQRIVWQGFTMELP